MAILDELSSAASRVVADVGPAVVRIGRGGGRGCGVVLSEGLVATNAHNLRGEETLVTFADGRQGSGIVAVNGTAVTTADDLFDVMDTADEVRVSVVRGTDELEITVPLSAGG